MTQPVSLTLTVDPWGGSYDRVENYGNLVSYYGPTPSGEVTLTAWVKRAIPPLHVTLEMNRPAPFNPHVSLDMASSNTIKNAHCYWNGGNPSWDESALDDDKKKWLAALNAAFPGKVRAILQEVVNQINSGVAPTYVAPVAAPKEAPTFTAADFPSLEEATGRGGAAQAAAVPVPTAADTPATVVPDSGPAATGDASAAAYTEPADYAGEYDANAPSAADPVYDPSEGQANWGAVGEAVPATAYLDESTGGDGEEAWYNFTVNDGRSLGIAKEDFDAALAGQLPADATGPWINVQWGQQWVAVPESMFEQPQ